MRMTIKTRLIASFALVLLLLVASSLLAVREVDGLRADPGAIVDRTAARLETLLRAELALVGAMSDVRAYVGAARPDPAAEAATAVDAAF